jgi:replicative DNA helicase
MKYPTNMFAHHAENSFIASVFAEPSILKHIDTDSSVFYDGRNKSIMDAIKWLTEQNKPLDFVSVAERLRATKEIDKVGVSYLRDTAESFNNADNAQAYYNMLKEKYTLRRTYSMAIKLQQSLEGVEDEQEHAELILKAARAFQDSVNVKTDGFKDIDEIMVNTVMSASEVRQGVTGIPSGFSDLDRMTLGWQKNDLVIIGARPSMGKTAFMLNVAEGAAKAGALVPIYSLEMSDEALGNRMVASNGMIDSKRLKQGAGVLTGKEWDKLINSSGELSKLSIKINSQAGINIAEIETQMRKMRKDNPERDILCMIDYLQLVLGDSRLFGNKNAEVGDISRRLKLLAKELSITIIALSQLSRGVEQRQDKRPMMSDIRDSGQIEQDADVIAFLYREDYYNREEQNKLVEVIIQKNREGEVGTVQLAFEKEYGRMLNLARGGY